MTQNVQTTKLASIINAWILALCMIHVERMRNVRLEAIDLFVCVQVDGQEILIQNVTHVGFLYQKKEQALQIDNIFVFDLVECQVDKDCPLNKACKSQECVDPCLTTRCGSRAVCEVDYHTPICTCPPGLQGNPLVACIEAGCSQDTDCAGDEKCGFVPGSSFTRKECQPLCNPGNCALGADCTASNHRETCSCRFPLKGDGYAACVERKCKRCTIQNLTQNACVPPYSFSY